MKLKCSIILFLVQNVFVWLRHKFAITSKKYKIRYGKVMNIKNHFSILYLRLHSFLILEIEKGEFLAYIEGLIIEVN